MRGGHTAFHRHTCVVNHVDREELTFGMVVGVGEFARAAEHHSDNEQRRTYMSEAQHNSAVKANRAFAKNYCTDDEGEIDCAHGEYCHWQTAKEARGFAEVGGCHIEEHIDGNDVFTVEKHQHNLESGINHQRNT